VIFSRSNVSFFLVSLHFLFSTHDAPKDAPHVICRSLCRFGSQTFNGLQFIIAGGAVGQAAPYSTLTLVAGETYVFNQSDPSNHGLELAFSLVADGAWAANGTDYDFAAGGGELVYFVNDARVNRSE
jgi:hypothetical protein